MTSREFLLRNLEEATSSNNYILEERKPNSRLKKLLLMECPQTSILVNLDKARGFTCEKCGKETARMVSFIRDSSEHFANRCCDYTLILQDGENSYTIIFLELKSGKVGEDVENQFHGARLAIDYLLNILTSALKIKVESEFHYVVFTLTRPAFMTKSTVAKKMHKPNSLKIKTMVVSNEERIKYQRLVQNLG